MRRYVVTISLPKELKDDLDEAVRSGGYATRSEFMRMLFRFWQGDKSAKSLKKLFNKN